MDGRRKSNLKGTYQFWKLRSTGSFQAVVVSANDSAAHGSRDDGGDFLENHAGDEGGDHSVKLSAMS